MTQRETAVLACRLFSIYGLFLFLQGLESLVGLCWGFWGVPQSPIPLNKGLLAAYGLSPVLILFFSIMIWIKAEWLASKMFSKYDGSMEGFQLSAENLQTIVFTVIGLAAIVYTLPRLSGEILEIV
jgi:hypothetical protein